MKFVWDCEETSKSLMETTVLLRQLEEHPSELSSVQRNSIENVKLLYHFDMMHFLASINKTVQFLDFFMQQIVSFHKKLEETGQK